MEDKTLSTFKAAVDKGQKLPVCGGKLNCEQEVLKGEKWGSFYIEGGGGLLAHLVALSSMLNTGCIFLTGSYSPVLQLLLRWPKTSPPMQWWSDRWQGLFSVKGAAVSIPLGVVQGKDPGWGEHHWHSRVLFCRGMWSNPSMENSEEVLLGTVLF